MIDPYHLLAVILCAASALLMLAVGYEVAKALWVGAQGR